MTPQERLAFLGLVRVGCPVCLRTFQTADGRVPFPHVHVLGGTCSGGDQ